jgi:multicomponent Na+:H+ antiporter subunit G
MIKVILIAVLLIGGSLFSLLAAIGVLRFPDIYTRMHAATKAPAFGILLLQTAAAFYFSNFYAIAISLLVIVFIFLTAPVASHIISRVAHLLGTPKWDKTVIDELENDPDVSIPEKITGSQTKQS